MGRAGIIVLIIHIVITVSIAAIALYFITTTANISEKWDIAILAICAMIPSTIIATIVIQGDS